MYLLDVVDLALLTGALDHARQVDDYIVLA
jgi:hypothetical protein